MRIIRFRGAGRRDSLPVALETGRSGKLALVIGRAAHRVPAERAMEIIGGYTCANDVTARDIQKSDGQWTQRVDEPRA